MKQETSPQYSRLVRREEILPKNAIVLLDLLTKIAERSYGTRGGIPSIRETAKKHGFDPVTVNKAFKDLRNLDAIQNVEYGRTFRVAGEEGVEISNYVLTDYYRREIRDLLPRVRAFHSNPKIDIKEAEAFGLATDDEKRPPKVKIPVYSELVPRFAAIGEDLTVKIANGVHRPNEELPGVRQLMRSYGADPNEIYRSLSLITSLNAVQQEEGGYKVVESERIAQLKAMLNQYYRSELENLLSQKRHIIETR